MEPDHNGIVAIVSLTRGNRTFFCKMGGGNLIESEKLPSNTLVALASASHLPNTHDVRAFFGDANNVDLNDTGEPVVPQF
jgi:hypothetical protein